MRFRLLSAVAMAVGLLAASASAVPTACPANFFQGQSPDILNPKLTGKTKPLCFSEFAVLHSGLTRTPLWSADHLTAARVEQAKQQRRKNAVETFHEERQISYEDRASLTDYIRSGFDRGHMSPNGDMDNPVAQGESFTLANMVPQNLNNNRGIWEGVEEATRSMAERYGEVWVVTIPIFSNQSLWLHNRVAIPVKIAKAVYLPSQNAAAAYLTDNVAGDGWKSISIAELSNMSGIDPFPALSKTMKETLVNLPSPTPHKGSF